MNDNLNITQTAEQTGAIVNVVATLANADTGSTSASIEAIVNWTDSDGTQKSSTASTEISINRDIVVNEYRGSIPALFGYVAGSAKVNGVPVTVGEATDVVIIPIERTLVPGASVIATWQIKRSV